MWFSLYLDDLVFIVLKSLLLWYDVGLWCALMLITGLFILRCVGCGIVTSLDVCVGCLLGTLGFVVDCLVYLVHWCIGLLCSSLLLVL